MGNIEAFFIATICTLIVALVFVLGYDTGSNNANGRAIKDKSICIEAESSGVKFKKCYEVLEMK